MLSCCETKSAVLGRLATLFPRRSGQGYPNTALVSLLFSAARAITLPPRTGAAISKSVPERIIKLDVEILALQERLKEFEALKTRLDELKKERERILAEIEQKMRERAQ